MQTYFESHGYKDICRDTMPDLPDECIGLFLWAHSVPEINDGSGTRYIQVQVRREDGDDANRVAYELCNLLDSGTDEDIVHLTDERWCIARPRAFPKKLTVTERGQTVYYFETALWGANDI